MNSATCKVLILMALSIASTFLLARSAKASPDCKSSSGTSPSSQSQCAVDHADFLFDKICAGQVTCVAASSDVIEAYKRASAFFDQAHPLHEAWLLQSGTNEQLETGAQFAHQSAILSNRAHQFVKASDAFVTCVELADLAFKRTAAARDKALKQSCAASNIALICAADPARAGCNQSGAVNVMFSTTTTVHGGQVSSVEVDDLSPPTTKTTTVLAVTPMPDRNAILDIARGMSDEEKRIVLNGVRSQRMQIEGVE